jgi:hypothetical protein
VNKNNSIYKILGHDFCENSPLCDRGFALSCSDITVKKSNGKILKLFSAGEVVDLTLIKKLLLIPTSEISGQTNLDKDFLKEGISLLESVKNSDEDKHRESFLNFINKHFLEEGSEQSFLSLIAIVSAVYYDFNEKETNKLLEHSLEDYKVGCIRATMSVVFLMALEISNQSFIQDFYRLSFLFDLGLDFSNSFSRDFNLDKMRGEENMNGKTIPYLHQNWLEHPLKSEQIIKDDWHSLFKTQGILKLVKFHHENIYGRGEISHLNFHEMSDIEALVILLGHLEGLLPHTNVVDSSSNQFVKLIFDDKNIEEGSLSPRIKHRILNAFSKAQEAVQEVG